MHLRNKTTLKIFAIYFEYPSFNSFFFVFYNQQILRILNEIVVNSDSLAQKMYQVVFNTEQFIENATNTKSSLTKKLKDLFLSASSSLTTKTNGNKRSNHAKSSNYDSFIKYYLSLAKIAPANTSGSSGGDESKIVNFSRLKITFFQYLIHLFKVGIFFLFAYNLHLR